MAVDTIEGVLDGVLHYHYDVEGDVLYLRLRSAMGDEVYGEEDEHGFHVLHSMADDRPVGLTVVGYWRQFGEPDVDFTRTGDWARRLEQSVEQFGRELAVA